MKEFSTEKRNLFFFYFAQEILYILAYSIAYETEKNEVANYRAERAKEGGREHGTFLGDFSKRDHRRGGSEDRGKERARDETREHFRAPKGVEEEIDYFLVFYQEDCRGDTDGENNKVFDKMYFFP